MKAYQETFNDGFLYFGHKKTKRSERGKRIGVFFEKEGKLAFRELSCRESDYELAGALGSSLDMKVKTRYPPSFRTINKNQLKCMIDNMEFDVLKVDSDREKKFLFFYLQEVGRTNEREDKEVYSRTESRDAPNDTESL
ncbi:phage head closure protein [Alkalihalobacillus sp. LMS39]|uniref:phage head closure protein n=1 Tax=Alkalihalobacillus sp. LMS39 TaxID=2924032 RepID=UPI001FB39978|nr:phage head closure protein [Alkalihalobacillus sp. LMS39]UOE96073.1 phage head closure protein [Alkalihalobacillus sp. LMS39]